MKGIAFFDFDGTIYSKDSMLEFIKFTHGKKALYKFMVLNIHWIFFFLCKLYSNKKIKEKFLSHFYQNEKKQEIQRKGDFFSLQLLENYIYPKAIEKLAFHKKMQHEIYLLTASPNIWLQAWCDKNDIQLICTELEYVDDTLTGKIAGKNCQGEEKLKRIKVILDPHKNVETYGYGDSKSDLPFLNAMTHSIYGALK